MYKWLQSAIWSNTRKTIFLLLLLPILTFLVFFLVFLFLNWWSVDYSLNDTLKSFSWIWPIIILWWIISFLFYREMIFKFSWARPITRKENKKIYNIVENLCISKWLKTPKIGIIDDNSMNAFALWWNQDNAWIVFSKWLIDKLEDKEIEAVAAHELTHILNKDSLVMITVVVYVWIITTLWEILFRTWSRSLSSSWGGKNNWAAFGLAITLIWIWLLLVWYLIYPLIQMAISRKREYLADAWSYELTKNKQALIWALEKISKDSIIESIDKRRIWAMCINNPFEEKRKNKTIFKLFEWLLSTHPSIEDRIKALESY